MIDWLSSFNLLAADPKGGDGAQFFVSMMPLLILFVLFYVIILGPQRKAAKKHKTMLAELKKNDRVITRGGIMGSVASVEPDGTKVTIKIDDNTRIPIHRSYIEHVLGDEDSADKIDKPS